MNRKKTCSQFKVQPLSTNNSAPPGSSFHNRCQNLNQSSHIAKCLTAMVVDVEGVWIFPRATQLLGCAVAMNRCGSVHALHVRVQTTPDGHLLQIAVIPTEVRPQRTLTSGDHGFSPVNKPQNRKKKNPRIQIQIFRKIFEAQKVVFSSKKGWIFFEPSSGDSWDGPVQRHSKTKSKPQPASASVRRAQILKGRCSTGWKQRGKVKGSVSGESLDHLVISVCLLIYCFMYGVYIYI